MFHDHMDATPFEAAPLPVATGFSPTTPEAGPAIDFPAEPVIDGDAPVTSPAIFAGATFAPAGGPCLMEPEVGSMLPKNWLRPRFRWIATNGLVPTGPVDAGSGGNLFELRLHVEGQVNDLVVYTPSSMWTMPRAMWDGLRASSAGQTVTMTVRGGTLVGGVLTDASVGSSGPLTIAPVEAPGTIVYWTTASATFHETGDYSPMLKGFRIGDESVRDVLRPAQVPNMADGKPVQCVGCHTSTPDGIYTVTTTRSVASNDGNTSVSFGLVDGGAGLPPYVSPSAAKMLARVYQAAPSLSPAHFKTGDRYAVTMLRLNGGDPFDMIWTDLEATSEAKGIGWGVFDRTGDTQNPAAAIISHDGSKIVYISTSSIDTSGNIVADGKLYTIPWNGRKGGAATEVLGANVDKNRQFYPAFSPDDSLIAFDRAPSKTGTSYSDPQAELHIVPASGGTSQRLVANDPPACSGAKSPGIYNAWPKWSPEVGTDASGKKYYFIVFSSQRNDNKHAGLHPLSSRLYVTPVVVDGTTITTYAALYLWNQPETEDNHSPAWDTLKIPDEVVR